MCITLEYIGKFNAAKGNKHILWHGAVTNRHLDKLCYHKML